MFQGGVMERSYEVLKVAIERVGVKSIAAELKLSAPLVYKWCQEPSDKQDPSLSGAINPLDRIKEIYEKTRDAGIVNWICQAANGYFVENALVDEPRNVHMFKNIQKLVKEFSETLEKISECFENDQKITGSEAAQIRKEWEDLKRTGEGFVFACELGKFNKAPHQGKERS
jgi:hypothetical protein